MRAIDLDFVSDALNDNDDPHTDAYATRVATEVWRWLQEDAHILPCPLAGTSVIGFPVTASVQALEGPGGWPVVRFSGSDAVLMRVLETYLGDDRADAARWLADEAITIL